MLTRIAIVSQPGSDLDRIRQALRNPMRFTVREFLSMEAVANELERFSVELMILRVPVFADRHLLMVQKVQRKFQHVGIVAIAKEVIPTARAQAAGFQHFKILEEPLEVTDLAGIAEKLKRGDPSRLRLHPRARREDTVQVIDRRGLVHQGKFLDFAQMGARLIVPSLQKFEPKDNVQIVYSSSSQPGRQHRLEAKIVWSTFDGGFVDQFMGVKQQTTGVRFVASY